MQADAIGALTVAFRKEEADCPSIEYDEESA
jgi:hypothetical protein